MLSAETHSRLVNYLMQFEPESIGIFGSSARGEETESSDVDLLVSFSKTFGLLQLVRIERELSEMIGKKVDLVTDRSLQHPKLRKAVMKDLKVIYSR